MASQAAEPSCPSGLAIRDGTYETLYLGDIRACESLIQMLKSGDPSLGFHAARALGQIGCSQALPMLVEFLDSIKDSPIAGTERANVEEALRLLRLTNIKNQ
jgi:HEAT repeat protein